VAAALYLFNVLGYLLIFGELLFYEPNREKMMNRIIRQRPNFPRDADGVAVEFPQKLLINDPGQRFDFESLENHRFFDGMNMDDVIAKKITSEFVPELTSITDPMYFDCGFTQKTIRGPVAALPLEDEPFADFDFVVICS
jgi:hypothetical protein